MIDASRGIITGESLVGGIAVKGFYLVIDLQYQCEADGDFSRGHGDYKNEHCLTIGLSPARACNNKSKPRSIQHDFNGYQHEDDVAPYQHANQTQHEQNSCKYESGFYGYVIHYSCFSKNL